MTDREDLIRAVKELAIVRGRVTLASGKEADYYVDMRRVTLDGVASPLVGRVMSDLVADLEFEAVGGLIRSLPPCFTPEPRQGVDWMPSWCVRRPSPMASSDVSRARMSLDGEFWSWKTPRRQAGRP